MPDDFKPQQFNLFRGLPGGVDVRGDNLPDTTMFGHFAVFDDWTEICSWYEGDFLERVGVGSFRKTFKENAAQMRSQFDHGYDTFVGSAPLGPFDVLREEDAGAYYEVPLLDTDYNRERVLPLLQGRTMDGQMRGSQLGASFRFNVTKDEWNMEPKASAYNPKAVPERTIREVRMFEAGPVVFGAYPNATSNAGRMRSLSDHYLDRQRSTRAAAIGTAPSSHEPREHSTVNDDIFAEVVVRYAIEQALQGQKQSRT